MLKKIANTIRHLTMDAIELAGSGHPGMPMDCAELGAAARVVSMPSWELFEKQPASYKKAILQGKIKINIEAGVDQGWHKYIGADGIAISLASFGESALASDLAKRFGYTKESIMYKIRTSYVGN